MKNLILKFSISAAALFGPVVALAQQYNSESGVFGLAAFFKTFLKYIIPILILLGVVYLIWGLLKYIGGKDDVTQKEGRQMVVSAIIALFVIVSIWGLVAILQNTFGLDENSIDTEQITPDCIPGFDC